MSRAKSVVLTKTEKAAVVTKLKGDIKAAKDAGKAIHTRRKDADKVFQAATKANVTVLKTTDKEIAANAKVVAGLEAQLASLTSLTTPAAA